MDTNDDFSSYYSSLISGRYDSVDRIVLDGYFILAQQAGGLRRWWRDLTGSDDTLDDDHLHGMAGTFSRRVHAHCAKGGIPVIHCPTGTDKHRLAESHLPTDPAFVGVFLVLVAKAPALVWKVERERGFHIYRRKPWPYVNHYHFHIVDPEWGHMTIKMSGYPPFGVQIMLNGHEWVERQARKLTISSLHKEGNCFVAGSDFPALDRIADGLLGPAAVRHLSEACDRWVYSSCLCFALPRQDQERSRFGYRYSCYQLEYSRNLLFKRGATLDEVFQGLIDRTRTVLDLPTLKTIFGRRHRPKTTTSQEGPPRLERVLQVSREYDLTVLKLEFGRLTLKVYDKGEGVLRIEVVVHNTRELRCGRSIERVPIMLERIRSMPINFLNVVHAAHISFLGEDSLDDLHSPSRRGARRVAGVNLHQPRMRAVAEALLALAPRHDTGFALDQLVDTVSLRLPKGAIYARRQASYDLSKLRAKSLAERIPHTRRYRVTLRGVNTLMAWTVLREKVIKPVLHGAGRKRLGRPPKHIDPIDQHYINLQREMRRTLSDLGLAS